MTTAAIYARKSTEQNGVADEQKSVARQVQHARQYAERKGWAVDDGCVFVDDGISGAEFANRPGFLRLMNALKPRPPFQQIHRREATQDARRRHMGVSPPARDPWRGEPMKAERQCQARSTRSGQQCQKAAILGGTVCRTHGGSAPQVKRKAAERLADLIDPNRALREAAGVAYSNIQEIFDEHGNLRPIQDWPAHVAAAVSSVEVIIKNAKAGDGVTDTIHKIRLWDKGRALELLFRHLGLLVDRVHVTGELEAVSTRLLEARKRAAAARNKGGE